MSKKLAFIGMGVMGYPMAGHLQQAGYDVCVYNRTASKAEAWCDQHGGRAASTPAAAALDAEVVFVCVGNDDDVRSVVYGEEGVLANMQPGSILIDHTTASADLARELGAACEKQGVEFLDAPVSGGQAGAENAKLTIMMGGSADTVAKVQPMLDVMSHHSGLQGPVGSGQLAKMVNQICIAGVLSGLSEGLAFGKRAGLDPEALVAAISKGSAGSWQMENRSHTMWQGEYDFGFAVDWMRKDLNIAMQEARKNGATLPVTAVIDQLYAEVQALGGERWDTSSLMARLVKFH
ncbi:NAD(P)-dependent oxidoreductase [Aliidiomarina maris]|uniref:3-hydroxyisobutyrate dehydrogenase/2-hydroxy-3-oxopropionate reductase n=1 Tax=Aliidiomarina maris TaxID=531312 RepID=A0A327WZ70_9GAMM|nr:NAD(P)-dependent oxidoreductase [Aliidiomarina maris]RAJ98837.1 3-hydroxyisobutyrate dehydrogenase/2-hydroxy-3-oxopropionate reductase [Aliidiomarina maris]RUO24984.1 oxidoreductase [Aliidiomarina maris]